MTAHLVLNNLFTETITSPAEIETFQFAIDATLEWNRVTLASKGLTHALSGYPSDALLSPGEFFLLTDGCCPCRWTMIAKAPNPVSAGTYDTTDTLNPPSSETITATVDLQLTTQNAACGRRTWPAQVDTWPYAPNYTYDDGALIGGLVAPSLNWILARSSGGFFPADLFDQVPAWPGTGIFLYPISIHTSGGGTTTDIDASGIGSGFSDSCDGTMALSQSSVEWTLDRTSSNVHDVASGDGSLEISIS